MQGINDGIIISMALIMGAYACLVLTIIVVAQIIKLRGDSKWRKELRHEWYCLNNLIAERINNNGKKDN